MAMEKFCCCYPAKEDILLAVFDRLIEMMHRRAQTGEDPPGCRFPAEGWERISVFLRFFLLQPPEAAEFHALQYTFLSQIGHRDDFRRRLASLYEEWRSHIAEDFARDLPAGEDPPRVSARTLATFVQALLHGLAMQRVADPDSYDRSEMSALCIELLGRYLGKIEAPPSPPPGAAKTSPNGSARRRGKRTNLLG
jgi:AcrR family transcriptional regulator